MIMPPPLSSRRGVTELKELADHGQQLLQQVRDEVQEQAHPEPANEDGPQHRKPPRLFHVSETAELVGIARQTLYTRLKRREETGYPEGQRISNNARYFALEDINLMRRLEGTMPERPSGSRAVSLAVQHQKGGVGKTTTAVNLAHYAAIQGYRVLLIDMDAQASSTAMHGYVPDADITDSDTILSVFRGNKGLRDVRRPTHLEGLDLVPACGAVYSIETEIPMAQVENPATTHYHFLSDALAEVEQDHDLIILDCPPSLLHTTTAVMWATDGVIVPVPAEYMDFATSVQYLSLTAEVLTKIERIEGQSKTFDIYRILISRYDANNDSARALGQWIRYIYGNTVLQYPLTLTRAISAAGNALSSLYDLTPSGAIHPTTYRRARERLDPLMQEVLDNVQSVWSKQANEGQEHAS